MSQSNDLATIYPRLYATPTSRLPFDRSLLLRSYILQRPEGNVIVYNSPGLDEVHAAIDRLGGAVRMLLNHEHEQLFGQPELDVPIWVHRDDAAAIGDSMMLAGQFEGRQMLFHDLEVLPTPGHTPGSTSFLWDTGEHRFLFTGDFLWVRDGQWHAVVLSSSHREHYLASLEIVRDVDFDVLVPWVAAADEQPVHRILDARQKRQRVQEVIDRLQDGENS